MLFAAVVTFTLLPALDTTQAHELAAPRGRR